MGEFRTLPPNYKLMVLITVMVIQALSRPILMKNMMNRIRIIIKVTNHRCNRKDSIRLNTVSSCEENLI